VFFAGETALNGHTAMPGNRLVGENETEMAGGSMFAWGWLGPGVEAKEHLAVSRLLGKRLQLQVLFALVSPFVSSHLPAPRPCPVRSVPSFTYVTLVSQVSLAHACSTAPFRWPAPVPLLEATSSLPPSPHSACPGLPLSHHSLAHLSRSTSHPSVRGPLRIRPRALHIACSWRSFTYFP
jgi:hypothetical protein